MTYYDEKHNGKQNHYEKGKGADNDSDILFFKWFFLLRFMNNVFISEFINTFILIVSSNRT